MQPQRTSSRPSRPAAAAVLAVAAALAACAAQAEYLAYAVGQNNRLPLPESIDAVDAKYLVNIEWGSYGGARPRIAVLPVDNTSAASTFEVRGPDGESVAWHVGAANQVPVNGIEAIVTDAMNRSGRFRMLERAALDAVVGEQDLAAAGRVATPSAAATGNVLGAEYLVQVVVTDYEADVSGSQGGGLGGLVGNRIPGLGAVGLKSGQGRVGMNFRLVDAETSEVVHTKQIESVIRERGLTFGGLAVGGGAGLAGFFSGYARTPIGQAVIAGVNKAVFDLVGQIGTAPATGSVVKAEDGRVWLNLGRAAVSAGDVLEVVSRGEELIDPETGLSLGGTETRVGSVRVVQVEERFSIAETVSADTGFKRGDRVVSTSPPPAIEYASDWNPPRRGRF